MGRDLLKATQPQSSAISLAPLGTFLPYSMPKQLQGRQSLPKRGLAQASQSNQRRLCNHVCCARLL